MVITILWNDFVFRIGINTYIIIDLNNYVGLVNSRFINDIEMYIDRKFTDYINTQSLSGLYNISICNKIIFAF